MKKNNITIILPENEKQDLFAQVEETEEFDNDKGLDLLEKVG